ncbi:MAG: serine/threonine-protein kinase [Planctomycetaceae bacterium]
MIVLQPCPDETRMWPTIVGDDPEPEVKQHLLGCLSCRRRVQRLAAEVSQLQLLLSEPGFHEIVSQETTFPTRVVGGFRPTPSVPFGLSSDRSPNPPLASEVIVDENPGQIGRYVITEFLGRGAQGAVYRGTHPNLGHSVVVKRAHDGVVGRPERTARLMSEGRILAGIQHPAVVRVIDLDLDGDRPFLVFEDCVGTPLNKYVSQHNLNECDILRIAIDIAQGIAAVHDAGVLHLDLKPDNILMLSNGKLKVIDFGIAWITRSQGHFRSSSCLVEGTPTYMAPEQREGNRCQWDGRTDLYGIGGILRFLLESTQSQSATPTTALTTSAPILSDQRRFDLSKPSGQPVKNLRTGETNMELRAELWRLCEWATSPKIEDRPQSVRQFASELSCLSDRQLMTRGSWLVPLLCLLVSLLIIASFQWQQSPRNRPELYVIPDSLTAPALVKWDRSAATRDGVRIEAVIPAHTCAELYLLTLDGEVLSLDRFSPQEEKQRGLSFPPSGNTLSLGQASGPQVFLLGQLSHAPLPTAAELRESLSRCRWEMASDTSFVKFDRHGMVEWVSADAEHSTVNAGMHQMSLLSPLRRAFSQQFDEFTAVIVNLPDRS